MPHLDPAVAMVNLVYMDQYKELQATELYCNRCKTAVQVRERLLLVIPGQNLYEYTCKRCGNSLGKKTQSDAENMNISLIPGHNNRR
jgi:predicted SprT family Zn-dependent metalloprotease